VDDIFTRKDTISGLKSSLWADLGQLVNKPLVSSIFAGRYHNFQYWFSDSIYIAGIASFWLMISNRNLKDFMASIFQVRRQLSA
jgi:hypothetical protein